MIRRAGAPIDPGVSQVTSSSTSIEVRGISMAFSTREGPVRTLSDVSLDVPAGQFVSIVGPSGCGKTTLLRIIAGLLPPSAGSVTVNGSPVRSPLRDVGMVFQNPVLMAWRSAINNILLQVEVRHLDKDAYRSRAMALIESVGLTGFENRYPHQLSGGMQQRVSLCRALIHDPSLLLMDEPRSEERRVGK